jgi:formamidopyrimidine-DNA glycosylase
VPEILEIEYYRRLAAAVVGSTVVAVDAPDPWYVRGGVGAGALADALVGRAVSADRRIGKLLLLDLDGGGVLGLRFGMTGVLELGDRPGVEQLQYGGTRRDPAWVRFGVRFADGAELRIRDPRRLGSVELDPDEGRLGPDAFALGAAGLRGALAGSSAPLKARLLDQARIAGLGNLLADEILWRAGLDPARPAGSLAPPELRRLHRHLRHTLDELLERGGSHLGDLGPARRRGGCCPRDGVPLDRRTIGGRTTYSCPHHQR